MSKTNLQKFYQVFRVDLSLQEELNGITDIDAYTAKAISLGEASGFSFSADEVKEALADPSAFLEETLSGELNDTELEAVSGGGNDKPNSMYKDTNDRKIEAPN